MRTFSLLIVITAGACASGSSPSAVVTVSAPSASSAAPPAETRTVATVAPNDDPCVERTCHGRAGKATVSALLALARQTRRRCYDPALAGDPGLQGHVMLQFRIAATGKICSATVTQNDMPTPIAECAAQLFRDAVVAAPEDDCLQVNLPLRFVPVGADAGP